jgi:MFS transporter, MHS family, shikimate and dehydroshikimate transport protein
MAATGVDHLAFPGHKLYAPFGAGALVARGMLIVFSLSYGEEELGIPRGTLLAAIMIGAAGSLVAVPFFDRIGRRPVYLWGAIASVALAVAFFPLLHTAIPAVMFLTFVVTFNTAHDAQYGTQAACFSELFSTRVRYSGISISAQLGGVLAGAFAPVIATALLASAGITAVAAYFAAACAVSVVAAYLSPETYQRRLDDREPRPVARTGRFVRPADREIAGVERS